MNLPPDFLAQLRASYPKRSGGQGWGHVPKLIHRAVSAGASWQEILDGTKAYKRWCDLTGKTGSEFVKQASTFFGPGMWWAEEYELPTVAGQVDPQLAALAKYDRDADRLGESRQLPHESVEQYRERLSIALRRSLVRAVK